MTPAVQEGFCQPRRRNEGESAHHTGFLVYLNSCLIAIDSNDLADELVMSYSNLSHCLAGGALPHDHAQ